MKHLFCMLLGFLLFISSYAQGDIDQLKSIIKGDDVEALETFLSNGHELNACYGEAGTTYSILVLSIKYDREKIFAKCLEEKADLDKICIDKTPLMYAVKYGRKDFFHALLKAGANKSALSLQGKTAYDYAQKYEQEYFISYLE